RGQKASNREEWAVVMKEVKVLEDRRTKGRRRRRRRIDISRILANLMVKSYVNLPSQLLFDNNVC
ncbi:hypothetical protein L9F63_026196, partial [Diploptera punctata]